MFSNVVLHDRGAPLCSFDPYLIAESSKSINTPLMLEVEKDNVAPRARDFPNPHDGEMKSDPAEKLYETPTKKTMILMKWVDWEFSEIQSITLSYNKNN